MTTPNVLIVQSKAQGNEFFCFRPAGNNTYIEIKFHIINNEIKEDPKKTLNGIERVFIQKNLL